MKKVLKSIRNRSILLVLAILSTIHSFAQSASDGEVRMPKHFVGLYSGFLPYVVFGVVILFLGYIGYRYWRDNLPDDDISHMPHHQ
jgi:hypothetical protein